MINLQSDSPSRRSFFSRLAAAAALLTGRSEWTRAAQPGAVSGAMDTDIGTLFSQIENVAALSRYPLSFLEADYPSLQAYRTTARSKVFELFHYNPPPVLPAPKVTGRWEYEDYTQEAVEFSTTPWFRVPAYVLIPKKFSGRRPGIVDLHSHGGMFLFGKEKVMPMPEGDHPAIKIYRMENYEGASTSLELCRRGYVVVSIDCFYFGQRRTFFKDQAEFAKRDRSSYSVDEVRQQNRRASAGEEILSKTLYWAGTTWQGIAHWDDIRTVDYLASRPDVDPERIGCLGISMGGDRTDYLAGLDERIACAVSVGWMSTLREMLPHHVDTHSFMHFLPGLTHFLDLPDLLGCMVPKPLMVQLCSKDGLYPLSGMEKSRDKLQAIYEKAGTPERFNGKFFDQPHIFSRQMQAEAFDWLDRWLRPDLT